MNTAHVLQINSLMQFGVFTKIFTKKMQDDESPINYRQKQSSESYNNPAASVIEENQVKILV